MICLPDTVVIKTDAVSMSSPSIGSLDLQELGPSHKPSQLVHRPTNVPSKSEYHIFKQTTRAFMYEYGAVKDHG